MVFDDEKDEMYLAAIEAFSTGHLEFVKKHLNNPKYFQNSPDAHLKDFHNLPLDESLFFCGGVVSARLSLPKSC